MSTLMSERARAEGRESGFTLIELLVVMIIISILMAVAVPTFLKQKQNAVKSQATSNIKQIVNAIEGCAVSNVSGSYIAPTNCTDKTVLIGMEPTLANITNATTGSDFTTTGTQTGYTVVMTVTGIATFTEEHTPGGQILKNCTNIGANKACTTTNPAGNMW